MTVTAVTNALGGSVGLAGTDITFAPDADHTGPASFDYTIADSTDGTAMV